MWTVEQLISLGMYLATSNDIPANAEIRLIPRQAVVGGRIILHKHAEHATPSVVETEVVDIGAIGHPKIAETVYWGYAFHLNVLVIILDG